MNEHPALKIGKPVPKEQLEADLFEAQEGFIQLIYGRIRQGKSTEAVRRMVEALSNGINVYSNIALDLRELILDDRVNAQIIIVNNLLFKKRFYRFSVSNYHFFDPVTGQCDGKQVFNPFTRGAEIKWLNSLTDCEIYYDEGQWLLDSYEKTDVSVEKRKLITESGHVNRKIVIIAQRTQSVHVNARGNVNQFFRCSKHGFLMFNMLMVEEFQDMKGQDVDETAEPIAIRRYFTSKKYWRLFNTHYLRRGRPRSQDVYYEAFDVSAWGRIKLMFWRLFGFALPALKQEAPNFVPTKPPLEGDIALEHEGGFVGISPQDEQDLKEYRTHGVSDYKSLGGKSRDTTIKKPISAHLGGVLSPLSRRQAQNEVGSETDGGTALPLPF